MIAEKSKEDILSLVRFINLKTGSVVGDSFGEYWVDYYKIGRRKRIL
jgi:hypothetical protein